MSAVNYKITEKIGLLDFLAKTFPDSSRTKLKSLLMHNISVDGRHVSQFDFPLQPGMVVEVHKTTYKGRFHFRNLDLLYEDDHLVVVNKHEGLLSYSKKPGDETVITNLNSYFAYMHQKCNAHIVHRLDRDTSGLMVVSKSKEVSRRFEEDWKGIVYDRAYVAVVWGAMNPAQGTIRSWLTDGQYCVLSSPTDNGGKLAVTHYRTLRSNKHYSLLELVLDTGRRNQIRVHMREEKHPVVHDPMYGYKNDASPIDRMALHAYRLCFRHPVTGKDLRFETPVPAQFTRLLDL